MMKVMLQGQEFPVAQLLLDQQIGQPATLYAHLHIHGAFSPSDLSDFAGEEIELSGLLDTEWNGTFLLKSAATKGDFLVLEAGGKLDQLHLSGRPRAWAESTAEDIAQRVLSDACLDAEISLSERGSETLASVLQGTQTDFEFLTELGGQAGFVLAEAAGAVYLASEPFGKETAFDTDKHALNPPLIAYRGRVPRTAAAFHEENGEAERLEAHGQDEGHTFLAAAGGFDRATLESEVVARAELAPGGWEAEILTFRGDIHIGDKISLNGVEEDLCVFRKKLELSLGHEQPQCRLWLVEASTFAAPRRVLKPRANASLALARVEEAGLEGRPGWCSVRLIDDPEGDPLSAQTVALGGASTGIVVPPAPGATVLLAFAGAGLSPRPVVQAVLRDSANDAHSSTGIAPERSLLAALPGGGSVCLSTNGETDAIEFKLGDLVLRLDADGKMTVTAGEISLKGSAVTIASDGDVTIQGSSVTLQGSSIDLRKG